MIPETLNIIENPVLESNSYPSLTYSYSFITSEIGENIDEVKALTQAVHKLLLTDRYGYEIYNGYYGNELNTLLGKPMDYAIVELPRLVNEALLVDDRITRTKEFLFNLVGNDALEVTFTIESIFGDINYTAEVKI